MCSLRLRRLEDELTGMSVKEACKRLVYEEDICALEGLNETERYMPEQDEMILRSRRNDSLAEQWNVLVALVLVLHKYLSSDLCILGVLQCRDEVWVLKKSGEPCPHARNCLDGIQTLWERVTDTKVVEGITA